MRHVEKNSLHLDRWHYLDYRDEHHDDHYIEWKYFNFMQDDLAGYIIYYILDPELKTNIGGGRLLVRLFKENAAMGLIKKISVDRIQFDPISANVSMDGATINEKNPYYYDLDGACENISWKLSYQQKTPSIVSFSDINSGLMPWESVNWIIKMPKAHVRGEIQIDKERFVINGTGYSDTNWGEIMPFFLRYEWGQYNDNTISFFLEFCMDSGMLNTLIFI